MKKLTAVIVIFACVGTVLQAQTMSFGGGFSTGLNLLSASDILEDDPDLSDISLATYGAYVFFDFAGYLEASAGIDFLIILPIVEVGIYGKYPIRLGGLTVYPIAGVEYASLMSVVNFLWLRAGFGADTNLGQKMFLRSEILYGIDILNKNDILIHGFKINAALGFRLN
jgi:hypothetical protein